MQYIITLLGGTMGAIVIFSLPGLVLWFSGALFDVSLQKTVLNFSQMVVDTGLISAVKMIWTASRDIANIFIIGIFVYIAISRIVGREKNFNRTIVSLIVVALLINFSFFFTQVAVDLSNWAAVQIYNSIMPENTVKPLSEIIVYNIGGVEYTMNIIKNTVSLALSGNISSIAYLMVSAILTLVASLLFFRIAFILISRWVLLIMFMATSALAFVAMLIPSLKKYWEGWYQGLIYNAIVAPLLLFLLWIATILMMGVSRALPSPWSGTVRPLDQMGTAEMGGFMVGVLSFIITLTLLYTAIKMATKLANTASRNTGKLGAIVYDNLNKTESLFVRSTAGAYLGGLSTAGRHTSGRMGQSMVDRLEKAAYNKNRGGIQRRMLNGLATHDASPFKKLAKGTYDARNTGGLKTLSKSIKTDFGKGVKDSFKAMTDKKEKREKELDKKQKDALQKERESQSSEYRQKESEKKNAKDNTENAKTEKRSADNRESNAERKVEKTNKKQNTNSHAIEQKEKSIEAIKKGRLKSSNVGDVSKATMKQNQNLISEIKEEINDKLSKLERVSGTGFGGNPNKKEEVRKLNEQLQNLDELGTLYTEKQELAERANTEKQELADAKAEVENANTELENAITIESDTKEAMKDIQDDWMKAVEKLNTIKETPPLSAEEKSLLKNEFDVVFDDDNNIVRTASTEKLTKMNDEERKAHRDLIKKHNDHIAAVHKEIGGLALTPGQRKKKNLQRKIQDKIANSKDFDKLAESIGADTLAEASKIKQGKKSSKGTDVKNTSS